MSLRYSVSENNYIEMLEAQLKRKDLRPLAILITFLCTVGQLGGLIYMIATHLITGVHVYILGTMSILIFALNILFRLTTHRRAVVYLKRFQADGKISPDFWKVHDFRLEDNLTIRFGSLKSTYALRDINGYEELPSSYIIYAGGSVVDLVPFTAIANKEEFLSKISTAQHEKIREDAEKFREDIPETYKYAFEYSYNKDEYIAQQKQAYRKMYTTKLMWKPMNIARLAVSLYTLLYAFYNPTALTVPLSLLFFLALNLQHIVTFTPLITITIKHGLGDALSYKPDSRTNIYVTSDMIIVRGDMYSLDIPINDFKAMRRVSGGIALYLPKNAILTVPNTETVDNEEFEKFTKFIDYKVN